MTEIVRLPKRMNESGQGPRLTVIDNPQVLQDDNDGANPCRLRRGNPPLLLSPLQRAHAVLIAQISSLAPSIPVLPADPQPEDVRVMGAHLWAFAQAADAYVKVIGAELSAAVGGVDLSQFDRVLTGALDGNAMFEVEEAAVAVEEATEIVTGMWAAE